MAKLARSMPAPTQPRDSRAGFVIWPQTAEVYQRRIAQSACCFSAAADKQLVGYLLAYDAATVRQVLLEEMAYEGPILGWVVEQAAGQPFIYIDELVVDAAWRGRHVAAALIRRLADVSNHQPIYGAISHAPQRNLVSIAVFRRYLAARCIGQVDHQGRTWGLYRGRDPRPTP
jgi:ribosomal protein S18 acetylase RimI-like enzyme